MQEPVRACEGRWSIPSIFCREPRSWLWPTIIGGGYFLAFSGGKDSQTLYHIAQLAGVRFEGHMNLTSVDAPEVIRFVRKHYPEVELIKPKDSIYHVAERKQLLPTKKVRWCCEEYKEHAGAGKVTLIGIRRQESSRRKKRNEVEIDSRKYSGTLDGLDEYRKAKGINITNATEETTIGCISGKESLLISPIINWTERDVWKFLNDVVRVPHCELYDQGFHRIGCIGCPMSNPRQKRIENERWPHVKRNWIKAIISIRHGGGISQNSYQRKPCGTVLEPNSNRYPKKKIDDYGYILHPDPTHWKGKTRVFFQLIV